MKIVDLIRRDLILPALQSTSKPAILRELATFLASRYAELDAERLTRVLMEREALASTAIGEGVAIPHGKMSAVSGIVACVGRVRPGVDFQSMDGQPTYLFFVLVAPESSTGAHLKALARISRIFKDPGFRARLLEAPDAEGMYRVIAEEDAKY
jgi:nitrogen PTS system EIIA component